MDPAEFRERLDQLQEALINLYEASPADLDSQIKYYSLLRKESVLKYYCRKENITNLGLHPLPALRVSEHNAKVAIEMVLVLKSLKKSAYAKESWTMADTNSDLYKSPPKNCFKKGPFEVEVWFDNDKANAFPYICWDWIYYQDDQDVWHKVKGEYDYNGLFYREQNGDVSYYLLFEKDSHRFGKSGEWTVNARNEQISLPITSFARRSAAVPSQTSGDQHTTSSDAPSTSKARGAPKSDEEAAPGPSLRKSLRRRRGGGREGESTAKRQRLSRLPGVPTPEEVGRSHRSVTGPSHSRLERLQAEARDPPIILIRGPANKLKCWRYRINDKKLHFKVRTSTVWKWVQNTSDDNGRMLLAFESVSDRELFLQSVTIPKGSSMSLGSLDAL
uniref:Regulatory protein E2 n=1 Tax=Human papillomavirus TaxID=10566 RepID=H2BQC4_9PAPI|nr:E2 protein [Human papillomavirus]